jgi:hypothetical protein
MGTRLLLLLLRARMQLHKRGTNAFFRREMRSTLEHTTRIEPFGDKGGRRKLADSRIGSYDEFATPQQGDA